MLHVASHSAILCWAPQSVRIQGHGSPALFPEGAGFIHHQHASSLLESQRAAFVRMFAPYFTALNLTQLVDLQIACLQQQSPEEWRISASDVSAVRCNVLIYRACVPPRSGSALRSENSQWLVIFEPASAGSGQVMICLRSFSWSFFWGVSSVRDQKLPPSWCLLGKTTQMAKCSCESKIN